MNISEGLIEEMPKLDDQKAIRPPIAMSELPDPTDFVEDDELDNYYPHPMLKKTLRFDEFAKNLSNSVTTDSKVITNTIPIVANDLQSVADAELIVANGLQSVANAEPVVANELQSVANVEPVVANLKPIVVKKIDGEVASAVISCYPSSLQEIKDYYLTTSFVSQRELTAYICKNFKRVFEVDNHIADLNKMTLERNLIKQEFDNSLLESEKQVNSHYKEVEYYLIEVGKLNEENRDLKEKVVLLRESSHDTQAIINLQSERDSCKNELEDLAQKNRDLIQETLEQKGKLLLASENWQKEHKRMLAEFATGLMETQKLTHDYTAELFNYAIDNALHLLYQDTENMHKGKGKDNWLCVSDIRPQSAFYTGSTHLKVQ